MKNKYYIENGVAYIHATGQTFMVDDEDLGIVSQYSWSINPRGYVMAKVHRKNISLHRLLLSFPDGIVDHINRDKLDNRRSNLRVVNATESSRNRGVSKNNQSGFKGVSTCSGRAWKYRAQINVDGKRVFLGHYKTAEEAHAAYVAAALKYFGEYAPLV